MKPSYYFNGIKKIRIPVHITAVAPPPIVKNADINNRIPIDR
jgi:hypothetical protein